MVRDVRYVTLSSSYRDLQEVLLTGQLKTLALVESGGTVRECVCVCVCLYAFVYVYVYVCVCVCVCVMA